MTIYAAFTGVPAAGDLTATNTITSGVFDQILSNLQWLEDKKSLVTTTWATTTNAPHNYLVNLTTVTGTTVTTLPAAIDRIRSEYALSAYTWPEASEQMSAANVNAYCLAVGTIEWETIHTRSRSFKTLVGPSYRLIRELWSGTNWAGTSTWSQKLENTLTVVTGDTTTDGYDYLYEASNSVSNRIQVLNGDHTELYHAEEQYTSTLPANMRVSHEHHNLYGWTYHDQVAVWIFSGTTQPADTYHGCFVQLSSTSAVGSISATLHIDFLPQYTGTNQQKYEQAADLTVTATHYAESAGTTTCVFSLASSTRVTGSDIIVRARHGNPATTSWATLDYSSGYTNTINQDSPAPVITLTTADYVDITLGDPYIWHWYPHT